MSDERKLDLEELRDVAESVQASIGPHFMCMVIVWPRKDEVSAHEIVQISQLDTEKFQRFLRFLLENNFTIQKTFEPRTDR